MKVSEAILSRRSMRAFKPQQVPRETVEWLIATASRAPSNGNLQPWKVHITMGEARERLSRAILQALDNGAPKTREYNTYPKDIRPVYEHRRKTVGKQLYTLLGVPRGDIEGMARQQRQNFEFFGAPVGIILCIDRDMGEGQWIDCGIFLDQLMLLAREKNLHTCPQGALSMYQHVVRRELNIPDEQIVLCGVALGYADESEPPNNLISERAPLAEFASWHES